MKSRDIVPKNVLGVGMEWRWSLLTEYQKKCAGVIRNWINYCVVHFLT